MGVDYSQPVRLYTSGSVAVDTVLAGKKDTEYLICEKHEQWSHDRDMLCTACAAEVIHPSFQSSMSESGYDQILAQIKKDAEEIEL